jgi:hypothetical protein
MSRYSKAVVTGIVGVAVLLGVAGVRARAQAPTPDPRGSGSDQAVAALVAEVRALRADLAAAGRAQLRAQLLLGRVQMQEQRIAYLDKQRNDTAAALMALGQMTSMLRLGMPPAGQDACEGAPAGANATARRECEAMVAQRKQQLAEQDAREQQLRTQESDLVNALQTEQARWSQFNAQLDELEQSLR